MRTWLWCLGLVACEPGYRHDDRYPLDALRFKGSHNSYHVAKDNAAWVIDYTHAPLEQQLAEHAVRHMELDIYASGDDFIVQHIPIIDDRSRCPTLFGCLQTLATWSAANPDHAPVMLMIETKESVSTVDQPAYQGRLHATIDRTIGRAHLITPGMVQTKAASLADALATTGWPTLRETRGKFLIFLLSDQEFVATYVKDGIDKQPLFVVSASGLPYSAITNVDDPRNTAAIDDAVAHHMLVRTRADDPEIEEDKAARAAAALASSAHMIATDYETMRNDYTLPWPAQTIVACHPRLAPASCRASDLERSR